MVLSIGLLEMNVFMVKKQFNLNKKSCCYLFIILLILLLLFLDNWALLYAQKLAIKNKVSLHISFCRLNKFLDCSLRHYKYIFQGKIMIIYIIFLILINFIL